MAQELLIKIVGDSKSYERALGRSSAATNRFNADIAKTTTASQALRGALSVKGGGAGLLFGSSAFVGAAAATQLISSTTAAASDLNEEITKSQQVFGASAKEIRSWSEDTAISMGISQTEALRATGTFGALFKTLAIGDTQNAELSKSLVQLASDMASFNNANPEDVLLALRSGLTGEAEPLRRFGVFLSEARTQQVALTQSGKESIKQLTNQEKVLARNTIIFRDTASAQGDFARTSGGLANQQRILNAQVGNLSAKLGAVLIPALIGVVGGLNDAAEAASAFFDAVGKVADIPGIDIPVNFIFGGGRGGRLTQDFFRHVILGPVSPLALGISIGKEILDGVRQGAGDLSEAGPVPFGDQGPHGRGPGTASAATQAVEDAKAASTAIARATARANASLAQQISDSGRRIAHLKDLIREDPTNVKLQKRLTDEIKKQNSLLEQQKNLNASNAATAKSAAEAAHAASVQATADAREAARAAAELRRERIKSQQFQALGLTPEGLKPTPGAGSLLRRAVGLQQQVKGTVLDTAKNRTQLKRIVDFLKKNFNKAGRDVREAILGMLNDISDAFENKGPGATKQGPLTSTHGLRSAQIIKNLGLSAEQADEIQRRLAHATVGGRLRGTSTTSPGTSTRPARTASSTGKDGIFLESHTTIKLDGKVLANVVTRNQQKDRRRNPRQKRGPHSK